MYMSIVRTWSIKISFFFPAPSVANVQSAIEHIFPLVAEFKAAKSEVSEEILLKEARFIQKHRAIKPKRPINKYDENLEYDEDMDSCSDSEFDSGEDQE